MNEFDDALLRCPITNMDNQWFKVSKNNAHNKKLFRNQICFNVIHF